MDKDYFIALLEQLMIHNSKQLTSNKDMINFFVDEARELAEYGELRIALENLLENMIDIDAEFTDEMIETIIKAFGQTISEYDKRLINIIIQKNNN